MSDIAIPEVDLHDIQSEVPANRERASKALLSAFGQYGLVYVRNHPVPEPAVTRSYDTFRKFVARETAEKQRVGRADLWFQRGWTPPNTEVAIASTGQPDFKECYFLAPEATDPLASAQYPELFPPNVWPEDPLGVEMEREFMGLGKALHETGDTLLIGCARALGLAEDTFVRRTRGAAHVTRLLHYLALSPEQVNTGIVWGEEHTDFNLLTLLPGGRFYDPAGAACGRPDDKSGLFLRTRANARNPAGIQVRGRPPEGCVVAQVGQQLEILSGGTFLATPHVITAPGHAGYSRMSSAHFVHLSPNEILFPLEQFQTPETIRNYSPPVLAGTFAIKTLVDIGLAPKEAIERLGYRHYDRLDEMRALSS